MKTNAIVRIVIWSIVLLVLIGVLGAGLLFDLYSFDQKDVSWTAPVVTPGSGDSQRYDYALSDKALITEIEIQWAAGSITIQPGNVDQVQFWEQGVDEAKHQLVYSQSGNKLTIQHQEQQVKIGIESTVAKDLTVIVPENWVGESIEIDAASAQVRMTDITLQELSLDSASGMGIFENCTIGELDIDTASGDIEFYGALQSLDFDAMSAKLTAVLTNLPRSLDMDTMSGDMDLTLPADCGFTVSSDGLRSRFESEFDTQTRENRHVYGDGSCRIDISAVSGNVCIRKGEPHHLHDGSCTEPGSICPDAAQHIHDETCSETGSTCPDVQHEAHNGTKTEDSCSDKNHH